MARRDNQGIQIAMIVFILTTLLFMVTTYFGYDSSTSLSGELEEAKSNLSDANNQRDGAVRLATNLKTYVGLDPGMDDNSVDAALQEAVQEKYGQGLPPENQNLLNIAQELTTRIQKLTSDLATANDDIRQLRSDMATAKATYEKIVADARSAEALATAEQQRINTEYQDFRAKSAERENASESKATKAKDDFEQLVSKTADETKKYEADLKRAQDLAYNRTMELNSIKKDTPDRYDGRLLSVVAKTKTVVLDIGSADGVRPKATFGVYDAEDSNVRTAKKKATVEITRVLSPHRCEARITELDPVNPPIRGDYIYSAIWDPGRRLGIALVGPMDIDKDGIDDRDYIRNLVKLNGGKIDAEDGGANVQGEVTMHTRYVVQGDEALDASKNPAGQAILDAARELSVERMSLHELLDLMSPASRARSVSYRGVLKPGDFAPQPHSGVTRSSQGNTSFQERTQLPRRSRLPRSY